MDQLTERLPSVDGPKLPMQEHYLNAPPAEDILARMLRNLKRIYIHGHLIKEAIRCGEKIAWLQQEEAENHRDLGFLYYRIHEYQKSLNAFQQYLRWSPAPEDADEIHQNIQVISSRLSMLN